MTPKSPFEINWPLKVSKSTWFPLIVAVKIQNFNFAKWQPITSGITPGSYNYFSTPMGSTFEFSTTKPVSSLNQVGSKAPFFSDMIKNISAPTIISVYYLPWNSMYKDINIIYFPLRKATLRFVSGCYTFIRHLETEFAEEFIYLFVYI